MSLIGDFSLHKMATKDHKDILQYSCRICGEIAEGAALTNIERFKRLGWKSKKSEDVSYVLQKQHGVILENDKEEVHPSKICSKCKERISSVYKNEFVIPLELFDFKEHCDNDCVICNAYHNALVSKTPAERGRPKRKGASATHLLVVTKIQKLQFHL